MLIEFRVGIKEAGGKRVKLESSESYIIRLAKEGEAAMSETRGQAGVE